MSIVWKKPFSKKGLNVIITRPLQLSIGRGQKIVVFRFIRLKTAGRLFPQHRLYLQHRDLGLRVGDLPRHHPLIEGLERDPLDV